MLTSSGCSPSDQLVILRLDLHREIYEHPVSQFRRLQFRLGPECLIIQ
jgi:hypothetical protein